MRHKSRKAMILAAGFGTRMKEYTKTLPKPLLPIRGIPIIVYHLFLLYLWEVDYVVINLHFLGDIIKSYLKTFPYYEIRYSEEKEILGTAGGIAYAIKQNLLSDYFLILNSDTLFFNTDNDVSVPFEYLSLLEKKQINNLLFLRQIQLSTKEKTFSLKEKIYNEIHKIVLNTDAGGEYFYTGMSIFEESFFNYSRNLDISLMKKELIELLSHSDLYGIIENKIRYDCGTKESYESIKDKDIIPENLQKQWKNFKTSWKEIC